MAKTVSGAFATFLNDFVNLAPVRTQKARDSRDAVKSKINNLTDFFPLEKDKHLYFGSFARRTKIRPIDDIDMMICINPSGFNLESNYDGTYSIVTTSMPNEKFRSCCDVVPAVFLYKYKLNSNKVKNIFKSKLKDLHDCRNAELHSNQEAVTLQFSSYEWNFDIVPAIYVESSSIYSVNDIYLIPDGKGSWKKTDPRKDRDKVSFENQRLNGKVLELIRLAKYWSKENFGKSISSYLTETLVVQFCENKDSLSDCIDWRFEELLLYFSTNIYGNVTDMKGIEGNINTLDSNQKFRFAYYARIDHEKAVNARKAEMEEGNQYKAITLWRDVFGDNFPKYE